MFDAILHKLSAQQRGFVCFVLGLILVLGALGKLGILQDSLNIVMVIVGLYLLFCGAHGLNLVHKLKQLVRKK